MLNKFLIYFYSQVRRTTYSLNVPVALFLISNSIDTSTSPTPWLIDTKVKKTFKMRRPGYSTPLIQNFQH